AGAQVDARVREHRGGRIEQVGAREPGFVTGDLHDGVGHRSHRRQPALERRPHARSLTMPTMMARPPRPDHRIALLTGCPSRPPGVVANGCPASIVWGASLESGRKARGSSLVLASKPPEAAWQNRDWRLVLVGPIQAY